MPILLSESWESSQGARRGESRRLELCRFKVDGGTCCVEGSLEGALKSGSEAAGVAGSRLAEVVRLSCLF